MNGESNTAIAPLSRRNFVKVVGVTALSVSAVALSGCNGDNADSFVGTWVDTADPEITYWLVLGEGGLYTLRAGMGNSSLPLLSGNWSYSDGIITLDGEPVITVKKEKGSTVLVWAEQDFVFRKN